MTPIPPITTPTTTGSSQGIFSSQGAKFDDNPFLSLLITQLKNQTPLEPVDNGAFMEQMASFSSMEEQRELNDNLLQLLNFQGVLAKLQGLSEGSNLLGKEITFDRGDGTEAVGVADSVFVDNEGQVRVVVEGEEISFDQIIGVSQPSSPSV